MPSRSVVESYVRSVHVLADHDRTAGPELERQITELEKAHTAKLVELNEAVAAANAAHRNQVAGLRQAAARAKTEQDQRVKAARPGNFSPQEPFRASVEPDGSLLIDDGSGGDRLKLSWARVDDLRTWLNRNYGPLAE